MMDKNLKDQNLADAPDDQNDTFNPKNNYSEPTKDGPVGPLGDERDEEQLHQDGTAGYPGSKTEDET